MLQLQEDFVPLDAYYAHGKEIAKIEKCEFTNWQSYIGGYIQAEISPNNFDVQYIIRDCKFENDVGSRASGAISFKGPHLLVERCQFHSNICDVYTNLP